MAGASPWLLSGVILVGITAVLGTLYLFINQPPRALYPTAARAALRDHDIDVIIDVRTDAEWAAGHYQNSIHIPLQDLVQQLPHRVPDRETRILFICRIGRRSSEASRIAKDLGYDRVSYLIGSDYTALENHPRTMPN